MTLPQWNGWRLIGIGQSERVGSWGLEGYGDAAENFTTVYLGSKALEHMPALAGAEFPAVLEWRGDHPRGQPENAGRFSEKTSPSPLDDKSPDGYNSSGGENPVSKDSQKPEGKEVDTTTVKVQVRDAGGQQHDVDATIPKPLSSDRGSVAIEYGTAYVRVVPGDGLRKIGVKDAKASGHVEAKVFGGGVAGEEVNVISLQTNKGEKFLRAEGNEALIPLLDNAAAIRKAMEAARAAFWRADKSQREKEPRAAVKRQEAELEQKIPSDHVRVTVVKTGDADGDPIYSYSADGVQLRWNSPGLVVHGTAQYTFPGALAPFLSEVVASIPKDALERLRREQDDEKDDAVAKKAEHRRQLLATVVPASALAAYRKYRGDEDRAWEAEDESAWAAIRQWSAYIAAQQL